MSGYWENVPAGTWTITDPSEALESLREKESRATFDKKNNRVNVVGNLKGKAVIIDLKNIFKVLGDQELTVFVSTVENLIGQKIV